MSDNFFKQKEMSMRQILLGCVVIFVAFSFSAVGTNIVELHKNAGKLPTPECLACHANIKTDVSLDKRFRTFHRVHLESKLETPKDCADCHESIDLREGSASALRKQVDPEICAGCHTGDTKGIKTLFIK